MMSFMSRTNMLSCVSSSSFACSLRTATSAASSSRARRSPGPGTAVPDGRGNRDEIDRYDQLVDILEVDEVPEQQGDCGAKHGESVGTDTIGHRRVTGNRQPTS